MPTARLSFLWTYKCLNKLELETWTQISQTSACRLQLVNLQWLCGMKSIYIWKKLATLWNIYTHTHNLLWSQLKIHHDLWRKHSLLFESTIVLCTQKQKDLRWTCTVESTQLLWLAFKNSVMSSVMQPLQRLGTENRKTEEVAPEPKAICMYIGINRINLTKLLIEQDKKRDWSLHLLRMMFDCDYISIFCNYITFPS